MWLVVNRLWEESRGSGGVETNIVLRGRADRGGTVSSECDCAGVGMKDVTFGAEMSLGSITDRDFLGWEDDLARPTSAKNTVLPVGVRKLKVRVCTREPNRAVIGRITPIGREERHRGHI